MKNMLLFSETQNKPKCVKLTADSDTKETLIYNAQDLLYVVDTNSLPLSQHSL